jgi:hypothetical protein
MYQSLYGFWLFVAVVLAHALPDFAFQTQFEGTTKMLGKFWNKGLVSHCVKYTAAFVPVFWFFEIPFGWLFVIYGTHMFIDRRWPIIWWRQHVTRNSIESIQATFWLTVVLDQIAHAVVIVLILVVHYGTR